MGKLHVVVQIDVESYEQAQDVMADARAYFGNLYNVSANLVGQVERRATCANCKEGISSSARLAPWVHEFGRQECNLPPVGTERLRARPDEEKGIRFA